MVGAGLHLPSSERPIYVLELACALNGGVTDGIRTSLFRTIIIASFIPN